ncbi:hypothetical protein EBT31_00075 [bacterium]|nr:hypothetical protein [bacterium]
MRVVRITPEPVYVETEEEAARYAKYFAVQDLVAVDTETTGLDLIRDRIKFFSFADRKNRICGPVRLLHHFKDLLEAPYPTKVLANRNYDWNLFLNAGIRMNQNCKDVVHADWALDENREGRHGLKELSADYLYMQMQPFREVFGGGVKGTNEEVKALCKIHDILEARDDFGAECMLLQLGRVALREDAVTPFPTTQKAFLEGYESILDILSREMFTASDIAKCARKAGLVEPVGGKFGYGVEFLNLCGLATPGEKNKVAFDRFLPFANDMIIAESVAGSVLERIRALATISNIPIKMTPMEYLRLQVADYASLDAWATIMVWYELEHRMQRDGT